MDLVTHILLVEDEPAHAELVTRAFDASSGRYRVSVAGTLAAARSVIQQSAPDLIISDWRLPDGDGLELVQGGANAVSPVVLMTSHGNERVAVDAIQAGVVDYVVKSVESLSDMPHTAERALQQWRHRRERDRMQAALEASERKYRFLAEHVVDVIWTMDLQMHLTFISPSGERMYGWTADEWLRLQPQDYLTPSALAVAQKTLGERLALPAAQENEDATLELEQRRKDGTTFWAEVKARLLRDEQGVPTGIIGTTRDITERKHAEEERERLIIGIQRALSDVSRSQKEWQDTFDNIKDMISIHDRDYTVIRANKAFSQNLGMQPAEVIGRKCHELMHHGAVSPLGGCPHQRTMEERKQATEEVHDELTGRTLQVTTFPYLSPVGSIIGTIHIARDVTEEKEREMKLIMTERLASLGQMAAGIAHEINNPLASVMMCAEMLLMQVAKDQYEHAKFEKYLRTIDDEVQRCRDITTNMLSFARQTSTEKQEVDIQALLDKAIDLVGFQGRLKNVRVVKRYGPRVTVRGNEGELRQVVLVLIVNALDAMKNEGTLTIVTGRSGDVYRVTISDTGPGIPEEIRQKIFQPFFTTKSDTGGTGLGLSIAHRIVTNHRGTLDVVSQPGAGAVFTIALSC